MMKVNKGFITAIGIGFVLLGAGLWGKTIVPQALLNQPTPTVSLNEAVGKVVANNPGTAAVDATLEWENNTWAWEVELDNDLEVYVDANTNQVIHTEQGWDLGDVTLLSGLLLPN
ncbi:PepSY domain-containing protein [Gloeocapsa sp. BRSZ]